MFEYSHDISLLHGVMISVAKTVNESNPDLDLLGLDDTKLREAATIVSFSVHNILQRTLQKSKNGKVHLHKSAATNRRLHAVVFHSALKAIGITADDDEYYESVSDIFPRFDWRFYLYVNVSCHWSDYFVECASQLRDDILTIVLKKTIESSSNSSFVRCYTLHTIMQSYLHKLLVSRNVSLSLNNDFPFNFKYKAQTIATDSYPEILSDVYNSICDCLSHEFVDGANIHVAKVFLHAFTTVLKYLYLNSVEAAQIVLNDLEKFICLAETYLLTEQCKSTVAASMLSFELKRCDESAYLEVSWAVPENFLVFLMYHYSRDAVEGQTLQGIVADKIWRVATELYAISPYSDIERAAPRDIELLMMLIECKLPGKQYALENVLQSKSLIERNDIVQCLEKDETILNDEVLSRLMIKSIMNAVCSKNRLVKLFVRLFTDTLSSDQRMKILEHIFENYGMTSTFKASNFLRNMGVFMNCTVSVKQAENLIVPLVLQSAEEVLSSIIEQAVRNGAQSSVLIKALVSVPIACIYKDANSEASLLVEVLLPYFTEKNLSMTESKNLELAITTLITSNNGACVLIFEEFWIRCLLPNIHHETVNLNMCLSILNVCCNFLPVHKIFNESRDLTKLLLVFPLMQLINTSVTNGDGKLKEMIVTVLKSLKEKTVLSDDSKNWLIKNIGKDTHHIAQLYATEFSLMKIDVSRLSWSHLWLLCCIRNTIELDALKMKIKETDIAKPYPMLVATLASHLSHLTSSEWLHSASMIEACAKLPLFEIGEIFPDHVAWNLSDENVTMTCVLRCVTESLILLKHSTHQNVNWTYIINCFTNVIKHCLQKLHDKNHRILTLTFWEVCFLASKFRADEVFVFRAIILDLLREIQLADAGGTDSIQFLAAGVKNLPECEDRRTLLQQLNYL